MMPPSALVRPLRWSPGSCRSRPADEGHGEAAPLRSDRRSASLRSAAAAAAAAATAAAAAAAAAGQTMEALSAQARIINTDRTGDSAGR